MRLNQRGIHYMHIIHDIVNIHIVYCHDMNFFYAFFIWCWYPLCSFFGSPNNCTWCMFVRFLMYCLSYNVSFEELSLLLHVRTPPPFFLWQQYRYSWLYIYRPILSNLTMNGNKTTQCRKKFMEQKTIAGNSYYFMDQVSVLF